MSFLTIRGYRCDDEEALLEVWSTTLPFDRIDQRTFHRKVLLDPNFDPDYLLVAEVERCVVGFCLCLIRRVPMDKIGLEPDRGYITAFGVHPQWRSQGAGSALLERAFQLFREAGRSTVLLSPYTPNYFVPGVDVNRYADGLAFLQKRGFEILNRPLSMDANIVQFDYSPYAEREAKLREQGIDVRPMRPFEIPLLMQFLQASMPGDWVRHARDVLTDATKGLATDDQFIIALQQDEVVGYCQFEGEHFGPFGVRDDLQGRGIGTVLMAKCLTVMQGKGLHNAWVLWTSDDAAQKVYSRFGFRETRRFAVLRRREG